MIEIIWKVLEENPIYEISNEKIIRNKKTKKVKKTKSDEVEFTINGIKYKFNLESLNQKYFSPLVEEVVWKTLEEAPLYQLSSNGQIRNKISSKILKLKSNSVNLSINKKRSSYSVSKIMRKYFPEILEGEIWRNIDNYPNYQVSNLGRIKNKINLNILTLTKLNGYLTATLYNHNIHKHFSIHRIVAEVFILNPENKPYVNHIDGIKTNNKLSNLEWTTVQENTLHAVDNNLINTYKRAVHQFDLNNNLINTFVSITEAGRITNLDRNNISSVCSKKNRTLGGFIWKYVEERIGRTEYDMKDLPDEIWKIFQNSDYEVSTCGRVRIKESKYILKKQILNGRERIRLNKKHYYVHRLVATVFLPNFHNYPEVDHFDENSLNNKLYNLRWISSRDNIRHSKAKKINKLNLDGELVQTWTCMTDAAKELNVSKGSISRWCKHPDRVYNGFKWRYSTITES